MSQKSNIAVVVVSCDNYSDLWHPFFTLFRRYWPNCPYQVYLVSNFIEIDEEGVVALPVGEDISWSDNLIKALNLIDEEYVFMIIDDLLFVNHVKSEQIHELFEWIREEEPNYVRLNPFPKPDKPYNDFAGIVSPGTLYRTSTVMSVWKKTTLLDLLKPGENAWEFEVYGTLRSDKYDKFYSTWQALIPFINSVIKGKWRRSAIKCLGSLSVPIQLSSRKVMTRWESFLFFNALLRNRVLNLFPSRSMRSIKKIISGKNCNYALKK